MNIPIIRCAPALPWSRPSMTLPRSEEHTYELQSLRHLVCRLLLEKKKFSKRGAAILISQNNLTPDALPKALRRFLDDPQAIPTMSAAATNLAPRQAA